MGVNRLTGTPWHIENLKRQDGDDRRHRSRCMYYRKVDNHDCYCGKYFGKCSGSAHCLYYIELNQTNLEEHSKEAKTYRSSDKVFHKSELNSYRPERKILYSVKRRTEYKKQIQEAYKEQYFKNRTNILRDIEDSNFVTLWDRPRQAEKCDCGGRLKYTTKNEVYFHISTDRISTVVEGKFCDDCKHMFIVKSSFFDTIRKNAVEWSPIIV